MLTRYIVDGLYTDPEQVVSDIIDAVSPEAAEALIVFARGGEDSGYFCQGATKVSDMIVNLQKIERRSTAEVEAWVKELTDQYIHYHECVMCGGTAETVVSGDPYCNSCEKERCKCPDGGHPAIPHGSADADCLICQLPWFPPKEGT
jgi:hypothetical protein